MLTAPVFSGMPNSPSSVARPTALRFGAADDWLAHAPEGLRKKYMWAKANGFLLDAASAPIKPAVDFVLDEIVSDQLHQDRALKDAYEILRPKDLAKTTFDQVVGHEGAKRELQEFVKRQEFAALFNYLYKGDERGANNAALLTGPAGTGKTMLGKAVAASAKDAVMVNIHCETLPQMLKQRNATRKFEKRLKNIFEKRIVLFFDEMEVIGSRSSLQTNQDEYKTITWLLKMMDGMKSMKNKELLIIGTTNHPELLDPAIRNRFQQIIQVKAPDHEELKHLYDMYLNKDEKRLRLKGSLDMDAIAEASQGFTGRKVEQVVSILKRHQLLNLPDEKKARLTQQIKESRKKSLFKKSPPMPDIKLSYTQKDLLEAIQLARSSGDMNTSSKKGSELQLVG